MSFLPLMFPVTSSCLKDESKLATTATISNVIDELLCEDFNKVVIAGPERADKTSLAFQSTVSRAASGGRVAHICTHPLKKLPTPVHGMKIPEPNIMRNVDFLYLEDVRELIGWCADIHMKQNLPSLVVVEDILSYASQIDESNVERSVARLCASLSDAACWAARNNKDKSCPLILTAPSRIGSLDHVLAQFEYKLIAYQGPEKDDKNSYLTINGSKARLKISFCRQKECILMKEVFGSLHNT